MPAAELFPFQLATGVGEAGAWSRRPILLGRPLPTILMVVCLLMLVVSSLLAYIFLHKGPVLARPTLSVMPAQLRVNDTFTLAGSGFGMRDLISFTHDKNNAALLDGDGRPLQTHADDLGTFSVQVAVPGSWQVGQHFIYVLDTGKEQSSSVAATLIVQRASKAPPLQQLASSSP